MLRTAKYFIFVTVIVSVILSGSASGRVKIGHESATQLPKDMAKDYALYAMMASNAYLNPNRVYFDLSKLGWLKVDLDGNRTDVNSYSPSLLGKIFSNLQYDIWEKGDDMAVIAFKGSDEKIDWYTNFWIGPSIAYKSAKKHVREYLLKHPHKKLVVTGHSLGGGIALSTSLWLGVDAYVFDTSPRVFDGWGDNKEPAVRKAIFQEREILSVLRSLWPKYSDALEEKDIYQSNFDFNGINTHRIDILAEGLLRCSEDSDELRAVAEMLNAVKVSCSL